jgi:hypothetical protein
VIGIFKQKNPLNLIFLLVFAILIKLPLFSQSYIPELQGYEGVLYTAIVKFLNPYAEKMPALYPGLSFLFLFLQALLLNRFMNSQRMMTRQNYLPGLSYLLITSLLPEWNHFNAPLLINTFLLIILSILFKTYNQPVAKGSAYNCGLVLGIAAFIFFPAVGFIIWVLLALLVIRPFRVNEFLLCLLGLTTPLYFYAAGLYLTNRWDASLFAPRLHIGFPGPQQSLMLAGSLTLLVIPFLTGAWYVQDNLRKMLINIRKAWSLFLLYMLVALFVPFFLAGDNFENWILLAVPFAAFHSAAYMFTAWRLIPLAFFWLSVAFIIYYQYYQHGW